MENTQVGPFLVIRKTGSHRRHNVYHARQTEQDRDVALKFLKLPKDVPHEMALGKIQHEVAVLKRLDHDHIVRLLGAGTEQEKVFLAHELIEGESLYAVLTRMGRLAPDLVIEYGLQLARALEYLHENELIHGNLLTDKVLINERGEIQLAGIRLNRPGKRRWDAPKRATLETAAYLAPEQLLGEGSGYRSDLYSLGVLFYEMLTGKLPFDPRTMGQLARDKQSNKAAKVTEHVMNCPAWLDKLIMNLICADPRKRPYSAKAVVLTLEQIQSVDQSKQSVAVEMTRGFSALTAGKDRSEARKLLGKEEKQKKERGPLVQTLPFLIGGLALIAAIVLAVMLIPLSTDRVDMMTRANQLMQSADPEDWREARKLYEKIQDSADQALAAEAREKYLLSRRKSMLYRLDRGVSGLDKPEIREFNRGYQLEKQRQPEEALAFYQFFIDNYDRENKLPYVYDEAVERRDALQQKKIDSINRLEEVNALLDEAELLASDLETRSKAHEIWDQLLDQFIENDFLNMQMQRAENGKIAFPVVPPAADSDSTTEQETRDDDSDEETEPRGQSETEKQSDDLDQ